MKTDKITVNKSPERPAGIEIEIIQPENPVEERLLCFLMEPMLRELKRDGKVPYDLPARTKIEHKGNGTFLAIGYNDGSYYEAPRPIAILGLRVAGPGFDLIHAEARPQPPADKPTETPPADPAQPA